jgi:hypothetical protein
MAFNHFSTLHRPIWRILLVASLLLFLAFSSGASYAAQWRVGPGASELSMDGVIEPGDGVKLESLIATGRVRRGVSLHLSSRGGDVDEGMRIGRAIKSLGGSTIDHAYCASSCALIFISGSTRLWSPRPSSLAIHQPSAAAALLASPSPQAAAMLGGLRTYCKSMTGSDQFYEAMMATPFSAPRALGLAESISMGAADSARR